MLKFIPTGPTILASQLAWQQLFRGPGSGDATCVRLAPMDDDGSDPAYVALEVDSANNLVPWHRAIIGQNISVQPGVLAFVG